MKIWACKIGVDEDIELPAGSDLPMRQAIAKAFYEVTGINAEFCFSGWNAKLSDTEESVIKVKH